MIKRHYVSGLGSLKTKHNMIFVGFFVHKRTVLFA